MECRRAAGDGRAAVGRDLRIKRQEACKPGSVPCAVCETHRPHGGSHSSGPRIAPRLEQPTRTADRNGSRCHPYSALLRVGFAMRAVSRRPRCALTAPFHPCLCPRLASSTGHRRYALCGTFPEIALGGRYPPPSYRGARTFLAYPQTRTRAAARPPGMRRDRPFGLCRQGRRWSTERGVLKKFSTVCEGRETTDLRGVQWGSRVTFRNGM